MHISARSDYALRALLTLAAADDPMTAEELASAQSLPVTFLEGILLDLRGNPGGLQDPGCSAQPGISVVICYA